MKIHLRNKEKSLGSNPDGDKVLVESYFGGRELSSFGTLGIGEGRFVSGLIYGNQDWGVSVVATITQGQVSEYGVGINHNGRVLTVANSGGEGTYPGTFSIYVGYVPRWVISRETGQIVALVTMNKQLSDVEKKPFEGEESVSTTRMVNEELLRAGLPGIEEIRAVVDNPSRLAELLIQTAKK